jgi:hypothetical protein
MSESQDSQSCWNGDSLNRYEKQVFDFTRAEQQENPELFVCPILPGGVRVQLAYLERVTQEINIISSSEACPEDDEDCQVNEMRCNYNVSVYHHLYGGEFNSPVPLRPSSQSQQRWTLQLPQTTKTLDSVGVGVA